MAQNRGPRLPDESQLAPAARNASLHRSEDPERSHLQATAPQDQTSRTKVLNSRGPAHLARLNRCNDDESYCRGIEVFRNTMATTTFDATGVVP
jgi:hypothetical protein